MVGGVKLNLTEFAWFVSFYIFTYHYLFQYSLATYKRQGGRRTSMAIENFECARHSLVSSFYYMAHDGCTRRKFFKIKFSEGWKMLF